jgi:hypothetical protein
VGANENEECLNADAECALIDAMAIEPRATIGDMNAKRGFIVRVSFVFMSLVQFLWFAVVVVGVATVVGGLHTVKSYLSNSTC